MQHNTIPECYTTMSQPSNSSIQARNMLDDMLEKDLEIVRAPCLNLTDPKETGGGIKLFRKAPPGIKIDVMGK
jgi:hypothetical protein